MPHKIGIYYDQNTNGINEIMSSHQMETLEQQIMIQKKSQVEAAFLQKFGVPGRFKFSVVRSNPSKRWSGKWHGGRVIYRIIPDSAQTYALLRKEPGWLDQFI